MINLFEKYKPKNLDDFIIDTKTKNILKMFIDIGSLNLLIIGDIGSGKSTMINILINEYYNHDINENNILYINLLKEQGIHHFRQNIKTFCQTTNNIKQKKFVIIDNIDQINEQTQQIIRNNIDKYSHKTHFILSCVNIQNVLDNLQSRTNIIKLHSIHTKDLYTFASMINEKESLNISETSLKYLVTISNNSIRLLLTYFTKLLLLNENININIIKNICTQISYSFFEEYTHLWLYQQNLLLASEKINNLIHTGYSVMDILESYFNYLKDISTISDERKFNIFPILCKYINIFHNIHEEPFELTLFTFELINNVK